MITASMKYDLLRFVMMYQHVTRRPPTLSEIERALYEHDRADLLFVIKQVSRPSFDKKHPWLMYRLKNNDYIVSATKHGKELLYFWMDQPEFRNERAWVKDTQLGFGSGKSQTRVERAAIPGKGK